MRGLIPALLILPALLSQATAADPPRAHNLLLFVAGGLRPNMVNEQNTPAMAALLRRGVTFTNTHASFPTLAVPNASSIATGHLPGDTGAFGNTIFTGFPVAAAGASATPSLQSDPVLAEADSHFSGNAVNEETILHAAAAAGLSTASIGPTGLSLIFDNTARTGQQTVIVDDQTNHPDGIPLSDEMQAAFQEFGVAPQAPSRAAGSGDATAASPQTWFADVAALAVLPTFRDRHRPFVLVFWSGDPDGARQDPSDSPNRLIPGINGPASQAAARKADTDLAKLLAALKALGLESTTDVVVTSDHGMSTISKDTATSYSAGLSYKDVPPAQLPPGFVAIDLAHALRMSLFDPDATGDARNAPLPAGTFPVHGNALIGDEAAHPEVVVAANGGSDLIYLLNPDRLMAARVVQILAAQDYVSGLFVASRLGSIDGTLPLSAIGLDGSALTPTPAIVVNFRTFSTGCADPAACGVAISDTVKQQGSGTAGSFSRADTRPVMGAAGPGFRSAFQDPAPVSTADLGRTIAAMFGLKPKDKGKLTGRVLTEALPNGAPVVGKSGVLKSAPDDRGNVTELRYQTVGTTRYLDAAGYPGRTLGIE